MAREKIAVAMHHCLQYGLGDVFRTIYRDQGWFGRLDAATKDYDITVFICSHNQFTKEVFKYSSNLNVIHLPWQKKHPNYRDLARQKDCRLVKPEFFGPYQYQNVDIKIDNRELNRFNSIMQKPVILIHPFAGDPSRMPIPTRNFPKLLQMLRQKTKSNIVIVGGSYKRGHRLESIKPRNIKEHFVMPSIPSVYNLVNQATPRLCAKLTEAAECFIGDWSAYACVAWERQVPMIMFTGPCGYEEFMRRRSNRFQWNEKCIAINARDKDFNISFQCAVNNYVKFMKKDNENATT